MIDMLRHFVGLSSDTADPNGNVIQSLREIQSNFESGVRGQQNMKVFTATTIWTPPSDANIIYFMTVDGGQAGYRGTLIQGSAQYPDPIGGERGENGAVSFFEIRRLNNSSFSITVGAGGTGGDGQRGGASTVSVNRGLKIITESESIFNSGANLPSPAQPRQNNVNHAAPNSGLGGGGGGEPSSWWHQDAGYGSNGGSGVVIAWW